MGAETAKNSRLHPQVNTEKERKTETENGASFETSVFIPSDTPPNSPQLPILLKQFC